MSLTGDVERRLDAADRRMQHLQEQIVALANSVTNTVNAQEAVIRNLIERVRGLEAIAKLEMTRPR